MDTELAQMIADTVGGRAAADELLAPLTTWKIGGSADVLVHPRTADELAALLTCLDGQAVPYFVLGNGSNILVADEGFRGAVISLKEMDTPTRIEGHRVFAHGATGLPALIKRTAGQGLAGLEGLSGIPGTVGGSLAVNAGVPGAWISDRLTSVSIMDRQGVTRDVEKDDLQFSYRGSDLKARGCVTGAWFELEPGFVDDIQEEIKIRLEKRKATQPVESASAGSVFKNPPDTAAGQLIDGCGCKGWEEGDAAVSEKHANFIINKGSATAAQVTALMERVREKVKEETGIILENEVEIIG